MHPMGKDCGDSIEYDWMNIGNALVEILSGGQQILRWR